MVGFCAVGLYWETRKKVSGVRGMLMPDCCIFFLWFSFLLGLGLIMCYDFCLFNLFLFLLEKCKYIKK
jgi:hypothetical protein